jgi:hypothetical protein
VIEEPSLDRIIVNDENACTHLSHPRQLQRHPVPFRGTVTQLI